MKFKVYRVTQTAPHWTSVYETYTLSELSAYLETIPVILQGDCCEITVKIEVITY